MSGGKALRGTLVKLGYQLTGEPENRAILTPAAAFEILHAGLLVHDDIIDKSPLRRGHPSLHEALGGDHYGQSQALCLGDVSFFLATKLLADSKFQAEAKNRALSLFSQIILDTIGGQMLDIKLSSPYEARRAEDIILMQKLKTATYTIVGPLQAGAVLGGATDASLAILKQFGENVGLAFQIQDDILGVFGQEAVTGKDATSDITENKTTLLITYALAHAAPAQRQILTATYGQGKITPEQHQAIRQIFEDSGARAHSQAQAKTYVREAKALVPKLTADPYLKTLLTGLADFTISRQK